MSTLVVNILANNRSCTLHNIVHSLCTRVIYSLILILPPGLRPDSCISPPLLNIHAKPNHDGCCYAQGEQKREPFPVVSGLVDDSLNNVGANHR